MKIPFSLPTRIVLIGHYALWPVWMAMAFRTPWPLLLLILTGWGAIYLWPRLSVKE